MNRIILERSQSDQTDFIISNEDVVLHLNSVLKVKAGEKLKVALIDEGLANVQVKSVSPQEIELEFVDEIIQISHPETHLLVGASRPPTIKKVLEHGTCMGVTHFHIFKADLSEKSYLQSKVLESNNVEGLLTLGLSQSANLYKRPKISIYKDLQSTFESLPPARFLLSLKTQDTFDSSEIGTAAIVLAIGPERGWTTAEEELLQAEKFIPRKISSHTLRVEIATFSALGQLELLRGNS